MGNREKENRKKNIAPRAVLRTTSQKGLSSKPFEIWQREVLRSLELKGNPLKITRREVVLGEMRRSD